MLIIGKNHEQSSEGGLALRLGMIVGWVEQDKEPRNKSVHTWKFNLWKEIVAFQWKKNDLFK